MTRVRSVRAATGVVLWIAAAVAATAVGMFAVGAIGDDIFGAERQPLSQSQVDEQLAGSTTTPAPTTTSPPPPSTTSSTPPPMGELTPIVTAGGTVLARCVPGGVEVVGVTPAQGFQRHSDDDDEEIDDHPSVKFRAGDREVEVRLRCAAGQVTHTVEDD